MDEHGSSGVSSHFQSLFSEPTTPVVIDMTEEEEEQGGYCAGCLKDLNNVNFLLQMKHVKECPRRITHGVLEQICDNATQRLISGKKALIEFLRYYGYGHVVEDFVNSVGTLSNLRSMDVGRLEHVTGVERLFEKKRLMFAIEQYKHSGCLHQRRSHLLDTAKGRRTKDKGNVKSLKRMCADDKQDKKVKSKVEDASKHFLVDIDKVLLDTFWKTACTGATMTEADGQRSSRVYEKMTVWCHRVVSREHSLWYGAADCRLCLEKGSLEERLGSARRNSMVKQGDTSVTDSCRTIATKQVRLKALKDELQVHLSTIEELQSMILALEEDIKNAST